MEKHSTKAEEGWGFRSFLPAVTFVLMHFGARAILEIEGVSQPVRVISALIPAVPFAWMLWEFIKGIRSMDELEQRIQIEALVVAFPLTLLLLMTLGLLELAIELPPEDLSYRHVWAMLPLFYFGGLILAKRRYQ